ncbi:hypothetical protein BDF21DRAFT_404677 [Thamnidium elegans]|nr:hypothetical protein BDF21DRAFT_404677 [Thamnidium elegans]
MGVNQRGITEEYLGKPKRNTIHFKSYDYGSSAPRALVTFKNNTTSIAIYTDPIQRKMDQLRVIGAIGRNIESLKITERGFCEPSFEYIPYDINTELKPLSIKILEPDLNLEHLRNFSFSISNLEKLHLCNENEWERDNALASFRRAIKYEPIAVINTNSNCLIVFLSFYLIQLELS